MATRFSDTYHPSWSSTNNLSSSNYMLSNFDEDLNTTSFLRAERDLLPLFKSALNVPASLPCLSAGVSTFCWTICILSLMPLITCVLTTWSYRADAHVEGKEKPVPKLPYLFPFIGNLFPLALNPGRLVKNSVDRYGWKTPFGVKAGLLEFTVVTNPQHIQTIFKSSKQLTSKPSTLFALRHLLDTPPSAIPFYEADDSGMGSTVRKGSRIAQEDRIHFHQARATQNFLSGQHLVHIAQRYVTTLERNLDEIDHSHANWVEYPDLYQFLQQHVSYSAIETLMGSKILELNPSLLHDFWTFDRNVPLFLRCLPRWLIPSAYKDRTRLLLSVKKWHAYANEHSDDMRLGTEDPEWDPYFGSKLIRARQEYMLKMKPMTADARASEDMGLMFAANANVLPIIFWYIFEALNDASLRERLLSEVASCTTNDNGTIDIPKLVMQPLLQSTYAEVLRLRVAIAQSRVSELQDFSFRGYKIAKNHPLLIFSRPPALNEEAWAAAGRSSHRPLTEFHADRFLVQKEPTRGNSQEEEEPAGLEFSLDGLAGLWLPFGGGQRMCPGRHFAKMEILSTFSLLFTRYEIELGATVDASKVMPDTRWEPVGALPPACQVPFRIRKKTIDVTGTGADALG